MPINGAIQAGANAGTSAGSSVAMTVALGRRMAKGAAARVRGLALALLAAAVFAAAIGPAQAQNVTSGTTIYGTGQSATDWTGGTIATGATLRLDDGSTVSGNAIIDGTLQFNQTGALTISNTISGAGTLSMTNTGTLTLAGLNGNSYGQAGVAMNMTTSVTAGTLSTGTAPLYVGSTGTGTVNVAGGYVTTGGTSSFGTEAGGVGTLNVSSGTFAFGNSGGNFGGKGLGTLNVSGGLVSVPASNFYLGGGQFSGASSLTAGTGVASEHDFDGVGGIACVNQLRFNAFVGRVHSGHNAFRCVGASWNRDCLCRRSAIHRQRQCDGSVGGETHRV